MKTKQKLLDKIAELQAEVDAMPDEKQKACFMATSGKYELRGIIGGIGGFSATRLSGGDASLKHGPAINPDATQAYADAFEVLIECRARSDWDGEDVVWAIDFDLGELCPFRWGRCLVDHIFGSYKSEESAEAVIVAIGKDRLQKAYNILCEGEW